MRPRQFIVFFLAAAALTAAEAQTTIYNYSVSAGGYAANGNLLSYTDIATGTWTMEYDNLNRLTSATASSNQPGAYQGLSLAWTYDSFGNRLTQSHTGTPSVAVDDAWAHYDDAPGNTTPHNQMTSTQNGNVQYDAAGNLTFDGTNNIAYDAEGRVCATAVYNAALQSFHITQYLYNAEGQRIAKGHPTGSSAGLVCPTGAADFQPDEKYILGQNGEQITQTDGSDSWQHTNIYAGGQLLATYDQQGNHFNITDPLGTKRVQTNSNGAPELACLSLPFGDGPNCSGTAQEATKHRFTGKERDSESGLDYFAARYYGSNMGRWMSPDWAEKPEAVPYSSLDNPQSLNLYGYVLNNPLSHADADGHCDQNGQNCSVWDHVAGAIGGALNIVPMTLNVPNQIFNAVSGAFGGPQVQEIPMIQADTHASAGGVMVGTAAAAAAPVASAAAEVKTAGMVIGEVRAAGAADSSVPTSIPAGPSARPTTAQQGAINEMGDAHGCSTCGASSPGTKSGNWVGDHQPPTALNTSGGPQTYSPQCLQCSRQQGGQVAAAVRAAKKTETPQ